MTTKLLLVFAGGGAGAVARYLTGVAARCYSLSSSPHDGGPLTVTVKRTADGYASNWICDHLREGSTIRALPPSGIFTPAERMTGAHFAISSLMNLAVRSGEVSVAGTAAMFLVGGSILEVDYAVDDSRSGG